MTLPARGKITAAKIVLVGVVYNVNIFQEGGPIGLVQNGDKITIDVVKRVIDVELTEAELEERRRKWTPPPHKAARGALWKVLLHTLYHINIPGRIRLAFGNEHRCNPLIIAVHEARVPCIKRMRHR